MKDRKVQKQENCIGESMLQALAFGELDEVEATILEEHLKHCSSCREQLQSYQKMAGMVAKEHTQTYQLKNSESNELLEHTFADNQNLEEISENWVFRLKWAFAVAATFFIILYGYQQYIIQVKLDRLEQHLSGIPNQIKETERNDVELAFFLKKHLQNLPDDQQKWKELYDLKESELKEIARYLDEHYPGWRHKSDPEKVEL